LRFNQQRTIKRTGDIAATLYRNIPAVQCFNPSKKHPQSGFGEWFVRLSQRCCLDSGYPFLGHPNEVQYL
jgi:hypothetical protein